MLYFFFISEWEKKIFRFDKKKICEIFLFIISRSTHDDDAEQD